ncbi:hypothetical protein JXL21_03910, partial [Candidatus Bathyarchaeota archaeon]|nr:hypothetical protein [Candidatus Bathyarchaeota archaeon]
MTPDGYLTEEDEWRDAHTTLITLGRNEGMTPPYLPAKVWAKNDGENLYIRLQIAYVDRLTPDMEDQAYIVYLQPNGGGWDGSDAAWMYQLGSPRDLTGYDGASWIDDFDAIPLGTNDVMGKGYHDGYHYWFEAVKKLDSGDQQDWSLAPGDTVGAGTPGDELLYLGLYDDSESYRI